MQIDDVCDTQISQIVLRATDNSELMDSKPQRSIKMVMETIPFGFSRKLFEARDCVEDRPPPCQLAR
jgi:hypothetical protein